MAAPAPRLKLPAWAPLVGAYALATLSARAEAWQTALSVAALYPASLREVSLYSLSAALSSFVFSPALGVLVARAPRVPVVVSFAASQQLLVAATMLLLWGMLTGRVGGSSSSSTGIVAIIVLESLLRLANVGVQLAVERDWAARIAASRSDLARLNSAFKSVDLAGKLAVPLLVSVIATATSNATAALIIAGVAAVSLVFEVVLVRVVSKRYAALLSRVSGSSDASLVTESTKSSSDSIPPTTQQPQSNTLLHLVTRNPAFLTCVSVAILYVSVLTPGSIAIAYLKSGGGVNDTVIALITAAAVLLGFLATVTYPIASQRLGGTVWFGVAAAWAQTACLVVACAAFFNGQPYNSAVSIALFAAGVATSRWGLWSVDLAQTQIVQEAYCNDIGRVSGVQVSLQNAFELIGFALTTVWSSVGELWIPAYISLGLVFVSSGIFTFYAISRQRQGQHPVKDT